METIALDKELEGEYKVIRLRARRLDKVQRVRDLLVEAGEDLRDWPLVRIKGLIAEGFLD